MLCGRKDSHEDVCITQTAGSWFLMSSSGQQTLCDSLAWRRLFVGTDILMRTRLGEEEAQAASSLLVLLPADEEVKQQHQNSSVSSFLESPWLLYPELRHNLSA